MKSFGILLGIHACYALGLGIYVDAIAHAEQDFNLFIFPLNCAGGSCGLGAMQYGLKGRKAM